MKKNKIPAFQYIFIYSSFTRWRSTSSGHKDSPLTGQNKHSVFPTGKGLP